MLVNRLSVILVCSVSVCLSACGFDDNDDPSGDDSGGNAGSTDDGDTPSGNGSGAGGNGGAGTEGAAGALGTAGAETGANPSDSCRTICKTTQDQSLWGCEVNFNRCVSDCLGGVEGSAAPLQYEAMVACLAELPATAWTCPSASGDMVMFFFAAVPDPSSATACHDEVCAWQCPQAEIGPLGFGNWVAVCDCP